MWHADSIHILAKNGNTIGQFKIYWASNLCLEVQKAHVLVGVSLCRSGQGPSPCSRKGLNTSLLTKLSMIIETRTCSCFNPSSEDRGKIKVFERKVTKSNRSITGNHLDSAVNTRADTTKTGSVSRTSPYATRHRKDWFGSLLMTSFRRDNAGLTCIIPSKRCH